MANPTPTLPNAHRTRAGRRFPLFLTATLVLGALAGPSLGQPSEEPKPEASSVVLLSEQARIDPLSLGLMLPAGVKIETQSMQGGKTRAVITPGVEGAASRPTGSTGAVGWVMQIGNSASADEQLTIEEILEDVIEQVQKNGAVPDPDNNRIIVPRVFDKLGPDKLSIGGSPAGRVYFELPRADTNLMKAYTVLQRGVGSFLILQLDCAKSNFAEARPIYEAVSASIQFDASTDRQELAAALLTGAAWRRTVTTEDLNRALMDEQAVYRFYKPSPTGKPEDADEVAFQKLIVRRGHRGELALNKPRARWNQAEQEEGYFGRLEARIVQNGAVFDTIARYFMSDDRRTETWVIDNIWRQGDQTQRVIQTVVRGGNRLSVQVSGSAVEDHTRDFDLTLGDLTMDNYLPAIELLILPRILSATTAADATVMYDFAFTHFDVNSESVVVRRDELTNIGIQGWLHTAYPGLRKPKIETVTTASGDLYRRVLPEGVIVEASDIDTIKRLWTRKGLPLD